MKKTVSFLMSFIMIISALAFSGCSDNTKDAESVLRLYFSGLSGFNIATMKMCVVGESEGDVGFSLENISDTYVQTKKYKQSVEDMYRALGKTFLFTINSQEIRDNGKASFNVSMNYADVEEIAMTEFTNQKVDQYVMANPWFLNLDEIEQNDKAIDVMADAYEQYLQVSRRLEDTFDIVVSKETGEWKVHTADNKEFFEFLAVLFG